MNDPTLSEMAEACERAQHYATTDGRIEMTYQLRAAARTLRSLQVQERKEQPQAWERSEQASAADAIPTLASDLYETERVTARSAASAADPPPPEDALPQEIAGWIAYLDTHIKKWADANDISLREILQRCRDRIAADAKDNLRLAERGKKYRDDREAAEARAQVPRVPTEDISLPEIRAWMDDYRAAETPSYDLAAQARAIFLGVEQNWANLRADLRASEASARAMRVVLNDLRGWDFWPEIADQEYWQRRIDAALARPEPEGKL